MQLQFGLSSYARARGDFPALPVVNMTAEQAPTEDRQVALVSRPGLADREADVGTSVDQLFQRDLVLDSALFAVSGTTLYEGTTSRGTIDGTGHCSMAGYETNLFVTRGAGLWGWDGTTLAEIAFPDGADVTAIAVGGSRLIAIRKDTGKFYWTGALGTTIDALSFATAENSPDRLLDLLFIDDIALLFGAETVEYWPNTGDPDLPFTPLEGRVIEKGIRATGCCTALGSTFAWITNDNVVCVQDESNVISNPGLQARIEASATARLFTFILDGTEYLVLRLDDETQAWNPSTGLWAEFASYGETNWLPQCYAGGVFGCSDGRTATWSDDYQDFGAQLERRFRGGTPINGGGVNIANVRLRCNVGQTPFLSGDDAEPMIEMRTSRDAGQTWGNWRAVSLGEQGDYRQNVEWRNCGLASRPGFLAEWRLTSPVPFRVSDALVNEPVGGR
jgi:hypothetical protein